jgi:glutamate-5-semialdehyde dehydrogenase
MNYTDYVLDLCTKARNASASTARLGVNAKKELLNRIAERIIANAGMIIAANGMDCAQARENGLSAAMIDRLTLDAKRLEAMAGSVREIAQLEDPVGRIESMRTMESGIRVGQMRVPVGVLCVIYESRPNVTVDIAALALKSGNAVILRGGREALASNRALHAVIAEALGDSLKDAVQLVTETDYAVLDVLLKQDRYIDIVIPRGGEKLIRTVSEKSTIPVIKHDKGVCHIYIDASAEKEMAERIAINAKVQRPGVCNAMETLIINRAYPHASELLAALKAAGVALRGDAHAQSLLPGIDPAADEDWDAEYLDLVLAVKTVDSFDEAAAHIRRHGSGHSEAIVTAEYALAERFLAEVDSAAVLVNASTRFHDGGEFGLGAEVGISTQKLHARGAMGILGLTCLKYVVYGTGQIRG